MLRKSIQFWFKSKAGYYYVYKECVCLKIGRKQKKVLGYVDIVGLDCETRRNMLEHLKTHAEYQTRTNVNHTWICSYCNQQFKSRSKLFEHNKTCEERLKCEFDSLGRIKNSDAYENARKTRAKLYGEGKLNTTKGKSLSEEHKKSISEGTKKYLENTIKGGVRYSIKACRYIDELNEDKGWKLQHAENGGEFSIGPYHLDGYDSNLNIAFEYDERKHHYGYSDELSEKDIKKMEYIKEKLNCRFFRYNESLDELKEF